MSARAASSPRVLQVSFQMDALRREPDELLEAWPTLSTVASAAAAAGVQVTVLQAAWRDAEFERDGVRYVFVRERPPSALRRRAGPWAAPDRRLLAHRAAAIGADLVHVHGLAFPLHARSLRRRLGVPVLVQDRGDRLPPRWRRPLVRHGLAGVDAAAFTACDQAEPWFGAGLFHPAFDVHQVLGSSTRFSPGDRDAARTATGLHGDPCVLWVGRLAPEKDPLTALHAIALAAAALPGLRLWCCYSDAPLLDSVRRRIAADPALAGRVHLLGAVPHWRVEELCRAADLFISASRREATGYALLEALACGLTPVVTDIPSFRRLTAGRLGALSPCGDAASLARAVRARHGDDPGRARHDARVHFERHLSFSALAAELRSAYAAVVREGRRRSPADPPRIAHGSPQPASP